VSLALGLAGLCCGVTGPLAVVAGVVAVGRIQGGDRGVRGMGHAGAGIALGLLESLALVVALVRHPFVLPQL
jgi:hypothetical protein